MVSAGEYDQEALELLIKYEPDPHIKDNEVLRPIVFLSDFISLLFFFKENKASFYLSEDYMREHRHDRHDHMHHDRESEIKGLLDDYEKLVEEELEDL